MLPTTMYNPSSEAKSRFNQGRSGLCLAVLEPLWGWVSMENVAMLQRKTGELSDTFNWSMGRNWVPQEKTWLV